MTSLQSSRAIFGPLVVTRSSPQSQSKFRLALVVLTVALLNVSGWIWALAAFHGMPVLLGVALLIYGLGLRHAVDADHIAAIDNVTRKLMQEDKRPVAVGLFFAIGHSALVILVTVAIVRTAARLELFEAYRSVGGTISAAVSAFFLLTVAIMNGAIFLSVYRVYRRVRAGVPFREGDLDLLSDGGGLLARFLRPLFRLISASWHMLPLGFLFGLSFDTATEVALFSLSAAEAARGLPLSSVIVLPILFAAGMALIDTADGLVMLRAYEWAFLKPMRKLYYNMVITFISVVVALFIGGIQLLGLIGDRFDLEGSLWSLVRSLGTSFNIIGFAVVAIFILAWIASLAIWRLKGLDGRIDAAGAS
ncbi:MAG TPA: HoxN/HupN/NixA family nickel/cobalt transporter [Allosphingosinicella sp.]